jgi:pyruvate formate lyase activating enzyme
MHFTAFHPDFKIMDRPPTPPETLTRARRIARENGVLFAYTGNVHDRDGSSTYCPSCATVLVERDWYEIGTYALTDDGHCQRCGALVPGVYDGPVGSWGARRVPVRLTGGRR